MNTIIKGLILVSVLLGASPVMALTIIDDGATFNVSNDMLSTGYKTSLLLDQDEEFYIYFNNQVINVNGINLTDFDPSYAIFGRIQGDELGNFFSITPQQETYIADVAGYLYLYNRDLGRVPAPATLLLLMAGLGGLFVIRKRRAV